MALVIAWGLFWFIFASEIKKHSHEPGLIVLRYEGRQIKYPLELCPYIVTLSPVSLFVAKTNSSCL